MILSALVDKPTMLICLGLVLLFISILKMKLSLLEIFNFWIDFIMYFFKDQSKIEKHTQDNVFFSISGWVFIFGWFFVISGGVRLLALE